jgi:hypothetical protein
LEELLTLTNHIEEKVKALEVEQLEVIKNSHSWQTLDHDIARIGGQRMAYLDVLKVITVTLRQSIDERNRQQGAAQTVEEPTPQGKSRRN